MGYLIVIKKSERQLRPNFKEKEFFTKSKTFDVPKEHLLDVRLINVVQYIRNYYNSPIKITSTYRTPLHTKLLLLTNPNAVKNSPHLKYIALDFKFLDKEVQKKFVTDLKNRSYIWDYMRSQGINGIGFYESFVHIDTRDEFTHPYFTDSDGYGKFAKWDDKKKAKKINMAA